MGWRIIGSRDGQQVIYDTDAGRVVGTLGNAEIFPERGADVALSPDAKWFVNGYRTGGKNYYTILRRSDNAFVRSRSFDQYGWTRGDLRNDPASCWNRDGTQILFPSIANDEKHTRQLFLIDVKNS